MLTKSDYICGIQCLRWLWINKNDKERIPESTEIEKARFEEGYVIEEYAKSLFPDIVDLSKFKFDEQVERTKEHTEKRVPLFQASFLHEDLYSRGDILLPVENDEWDIIEVKSSTEAKKIHLEDLAFQKYVYEKNGLKIRKCFVLHVNKEYVRQGEINPKELLMQTEVTEKVEAIEEVKSRSINMLDCINGECPDFQVDDLLTIEYENIAKDEFMESLPENNIFEFVRILKKKAVPLYKEGIVKMTEIPNDFKLNDKQKIQKDVAENGGKHIDKKQIKNFLDNLKYPLYYFDFETIYSAVPRFDNSKPYQQIPFQFSLHIQEEPNGELKHISFLAEGKEDPRLALLKSLKENLGDKGDILVYNQSFEKKVLKELGEFFPEFNELIENNFLQRIKDLMEVFSKFYYYDQKQRGSVSIKYVLPLLSDLKYDGIDISKGDVASFEFERVTYGDVPEEERQKIRKALEEYCKLDTMAEVEIIGALGKIVKDE
ncbi:MAG: DUF2779 domain-containing protein [archaeon]